AGAVLPPHRAVRRGEVGEDAVERFVRHQAVEDDVRERLAGGVLAPPLASQLLQALRLEVQLHGDHSLPNPGTARPRHHTPRRTAEEPKKPPRAPQYSA